MLKILREDLEITEKKYYESIKEKEFLKAQLNLNNNKYPERLTNSNIENKNNEIILKNKNFVDNKNNPFDKKNIKSNNNTSTINNDSDDDLMNKTIDINHKGSNFSIFSKNLVFKNSKVKILFFIFRLQKIII